jgi:hypothetical protein
MTAKTARQTLTVLLTACVIVPIAMAKGHARAVYSGLTAHEWGTFTCIAGADGQAVEWLPRTGSTDLPSFVEHFRNAGFKLGLRGTVRMETPVLYFYSPREETVSVKVSFASGVITEWYPHATRVEPTAALWDGSLYRDRSDGSISWDEVVVAPSQTADLLNDRRENHYYAARQAASTPLRVKTSSGEQYEKFLFYRGVSAFSVPVSATLDDGNKLRVENRSGQPLPNTILFERRGENVGFRVNGALQNEALLDPPQLTNSVDALAQELEGILVAQGLYQNEAQAMVQTWRDSWFEEGSRLLYIVPTNFVNTVLPLSIKPAPVQTTRVFVGRLELVTPATQTAVEHAFAAHDDATLANYARFLEPILNTMIKQAATPAKAQQLREYLSAYYNSALLRNQRRD